MVKKITRDVHTETSSRHQYSVWHYLLSDAGEVIYRAWAQPINPKTKLVWQANRRVMDGANRSYIEYTDGRYKVIEAGTYNSEDYAPYYTGDRGFYATLDEAKQAITNHRKRMEK